MDVAIRVSPRRCAVALGATVAILVVASLASSYLALGSVQDPFLAKATQSIVRLVWLDGECNIPSWFSSALLLLCSLLLAVIASAQRPIAGGYFGHWLVLSLIFAFLSLDETAQLHELSIVPLRDTFHTGGFLLYPWIIPAVICLALFGVSYLRFLTKLPRRTRRLFIIAGVIYVGGAIGVEALSGEEASLHGERNAMYHAITTVEESLEMTGLVVFIYALLDYLGREFTSLRVHLTAR